MGMAVMAKHTADQFELKKLRHRNERLKYELAKTVAALTIMGKAHEPLKLFSESSATGRVSSNPSTQPQSSCRRAPSNVTAHFWADHRPDTCGPCRHHRHPHKPRATAPNALSRS